MSEREHHLAVRRTARYHTLGAPSAGVRQVWFVLHGHGQLAAYFIRNFAVLDDGTRLIVAPEALNRFYLEPTSWTGAAQARVGATWMTREDRLVEIEDYVAYLDTLHDHVCAGIDRAGVRLVVLGFSQGVATAFRWACRGRLRTDTLIAWAGPIPPELDAAAVQPLRTAKLIRVLGNQDEMATDQIVAADDARFAELALRSELVRFAGGHEVHADTLRSLPV